MSKSDAFELSLLKLIFSNTVLSNLGDSTGLRASVSAGALWISLHTADPGETGLQNTSEATYTGYARVSVNRTQVAGGWAFSTASPALAANFSDIVFPTCTASSNVITHFGIGTASTGAGYLLYSGSVSPSRTVTQNIAPTFLAGALIVEED